VFDELRDRKVVAPLLSELQKIAKDLSPVRIMEVCGTHTVTAFRSGLGNMLKKMGIELISGPGCPVCITPDEIVAGAVDLLIRQKDVILTSFGDMLRVPTSKGSLLSINPAPGSSVKIIYSPEEVLAIASGNPGKETVFLAVGFETTAPAIAYIVREAADKKLKNLSFITSLRLVPPPLRAILSSGETKLNGLLYPGHVSVIIGSKPYEFVPREFNVPGAVTGFEPADMLLGILSVLKQIKKGKPIVDIAYKRAVRPEGNKMAQEIISEIFDVEDSLWRGFGVIPKSGLRLKEKFKAMSADARFNLKHEGWGVRGCRCGEVVKGKISPEDCPMFGKDCNPDSPKGPCMVSYEGSCLVHYKYRGIEWKM